MEPDYFDFCSQGKFCEKKRLFFLTLYINEKLVGPLSSRIGSKFPGLPGVRYGSCSDRLKKRDNQTFSTFPAQLIPKERHF
jgi:hypothetical protein